MKKNLSIFFLLKYDECDSDLDGKEISYFLYGSKIHEASQLKDKVRSTPRIKFYLEQRQA